MSSRNEAAWCYLEGFGGKKDKVSNDDCFSEISKSTTSSSTDPEPVTLFATSLCFEFRQIYAGTEPHEAGKPSHVQHMQDTRRSHGAALTTLAFATTVILDKAARLRRIDGYSFTFTRNAPKYRQYTLNTVNRQWRHHFLGSNA